MGFYFGKVKIKMEVCWEFSSWVVIICMASGKVFGKKMEGLQERFGRDWLEGKKRPGCYPEPLPKNL